MSKSRVRYDRLYVAGSWTDPIDATYEVLNPATEEVVAHIALAREGDADAAVAAASKLHESGEWANRSHKDRAAVISTIADAVEARTDDFAEAYIRDQGGLVSMAVPMVGACVQILRDNARLIAELDEGPEIRTGSGAEVHIHRVPVGPVLASVPWNAPLMLAAVKAGSALAAGCPVIIKADIQTPLTAFILSDVLDSVELPAGLVSVLPADVDVAKYLVSHPGIKHISFTGSTVVGKEVMKAAAENMTRVTLELGGKSAAIILDDVDPASAMSLYAGCLMQTGQVCTAYTRLLVPESRLAEWETALAEMFDSLPIGAPTDPATMIGPLVSEKQLANVERHVEIARSEGRILTGGARPQGLESGYWYEPTLVTDVSPESRIAQEEVFGPVFVVLPYRDVDDAVRIAHDSAYGLAAGVFATDVKRAKAIASRLRAGAVNINTFGTNLFEPYGGFGASGMGREGGLEGILEFMELTQVQIVQ